MKGVILDIDIQIQIGDSVSGNDLCEFNGGMNQIEMTNKLSRSVVE